MRVPHRLVVDTNDPKDDKFLELALNGRADVQQMRIRWRSVRGGKWRFYRLRIIRSVDRTSLFRFRNLPQKPPVKSG
jgi:hypothetical protein